MTLYPPLWAQNTKYPAAYDRMLFSSAFRPGVFVSTDLRVRQRGQGAAMSVDVAAGSAILPGPTGNYLVLSDAIENRAIAAAPASGNSRIDLVIARVVDNQATGQGDPATPASWAIEVLTGAAVTSNPAPPALPAYAIGLAQVLVRATDVSVLDASITGVRPTSRPGAQGTVAYGKRTTNVSGSAGSPAPAATVSADIMAARRIRITAHAYCTINVANSYISGTVLDNGVQIVRFGWANSSAAFERTVFEGSAIVDYQTSGPHTYQSMIYTASGGGVTVNAAEDPSFLHVEDVGASGTGGAAA